MNVHNIFTPSSWKRKVHDPVQYCAKQMLTNFVKSHSSFSHILSKFHQQTKQRHPNFICLTFVTIFFKQSAVNLPNFDVTIQTSNSSTIHVVPEANNAG